MSLFYDHFADEREATVRRKGGAYIISTDPTTYRLAMAALAEHDFEGAVDELAGDPSMTVVAAMHYSRLQGRSCVFVLQGLSEGGN